MKKGMTLIEILVTALILVIALTSLMSSFVYCTKLNIRNSHRHNATLIINQHFEEIMRQESPQALDDYLSIKSNTFHNRKASISPIYHKYYLKIYDIGTAHPTTEDTLRVLEASVTWSGNYDNPDPIDQIEMQIIANEPNL